MDRLLRKFRAAATVVIDESFARHCCGSHNPLKSWRNSPRHSQITWPIGLGGDSSVFSVCKNSKKYGKFTVAKLHNKRSRGAMSMLSRRHCSICSKHIQRHAKTLGRGTKVKIRSGSGGQASWYKVHM